MAKRILLAWGDHGFRDGQGHFLSYTQFCDGDGKPTNPALHLARGIIYSVQAQIPAVTVAVPNLLFLAPGSSNRMLRIGVTPVSFTTSLLCP